MPIATWLTGKAAACYVAFAAACYWSASQATGPAWNTWIEEIVPKRLRTRFFAVRARVCQSATLAGFVIGALALEYGKSGGWLLSAFAGIFLLGAACRYASAWFLSRQSEPSRGRYPFRRVGLRQALVQQGRRAGRPLVLYLLLMQAAVQISGPYFAPYMLGHLRLSYVSFMILLGLGFVGKVIALPLWGRVAHRAGAARLLWIGGTSIVPVAGLWLVADWLPPRTLFGGVSLEMVYLASVQLLSGFVWAAYELAMLLMFLEAIPRADRPSVITYYNFGNAAAQVVGGLIGAVILQLGGETHAAYMVIFAGSSVMRLATVPLLRLTTKAAPLQAELVLAQAA
jgi:MFS family permease